MRSNKMKFISIKDAMKKGEGEVSIRGWVYRERGSAKLKFIILRDVTGTIQCVIEKAIVGEEKFQIADKLQIEASMTITGTIKEDERAPTGYEISVKDFELIGESKEFPIQKDQSPDFLADHRHLWLRSQKMTASLKIRSNILFALHEFSKNQGFIEVQAPSMSGAASEGGSEVFEVKYFDKKAYMTQSWQFYAENIIQSVEKAYAIAPSFRAEKSRTPWHVTEFWHYELEAAWFDLKQNMETAENCIYYVIKKILEENLDDLIFLGANVELLKNLKLPFKRLTYIDAIKLLKENGHEINEGDDFKSAEERSLAKYCGDEFVFVTNYPLKLLKFYHGEDPSQPGTGTNFNLLAPGVGEMVDGSQRELDLNKIVERLKKAEIDLGASDWYLDSRRYGSVPHAGFGLGIERFAAWICGFDTIKDSIPFPRTPTRFNP